MVTRQQLNVTTEQFNSEVSRITSNGWVVRGGSQKAYLISINGDVKELNGIPSDVTYYIRPHWSDKDKLFYWAGTSVYTYDINTQKSELYWNTGFTIIPRSVKGDRNDGEYNADGDYLFLFSETPNTGCRVANLTKKQWVTKRAFTIPSSFDHAQVAPSGDHIQISDADTSAYDFEGNKLFSITSYAGHMDTATFTYKNSRWNGVMWRQSNTGKNPGDLMLTLYKLTGEKEEITLDPNDEKMVPACVIGQVSASPINRHFMCHISNMNEYCSDERARRIGLISLDLDNTNIPKYQEIAKHENIPSAVTSTQPEAFIGPIVDGKQYILARITETSGKKLYIYAVDVAEYITGTIKDEEKVVDYQLEYEILNAAYADLAKSYADLEDKLELANQNLDTSAIILANLKADKEGLVAALAERDLKILSQTSVIEAIKQLVHANI